MVDYRLERLNEENADTWEEFNATCLDGTLFHDLRWKQIAEKCSGIPRQYFLLFKDDAIYGLFPFVGLSIHSFRGLVPASDPMSLHAILKDYSDPSAMQYVIKELRQMGGDTKRISFISAATVRKEAFDSITNYPLFPYGSEGDMVLDLKEFPPEKIWNSFSEKKGQRKYIRRFEKNGFEISEATSLDDLKTFYQYYESNMDYIGGTLLPFSHFTDLWKSMPDEIRITLLSKGSLVAGGLLQLQDKPRKTVYASYLSLNRNLPNTYHPTYSLDWEAVNWAWEKNYEKVSFGMEYSKDLTESNPRYRIKRDFGARFTPVYSMIIPLTKIFSLCMRSKDWWQSTRTQ